MKPAGIIGIILIVIGIIALAYGGITYTKREKVLDLGPIQATAERQKTIPFPPILGGICLVGGIVLVIVGNRTAESETSSGVAAFAAVVCAVFGASALCENGQS
jgi:uncharacterized membrane protein